MRDPELERLLRAAANTEDSPPSVPFGFDTRVVAQWRAAGATTDNSYWELARLLQRVIVTAAAVTVLASAATYWQWDEEENSGAPFANAYALTDSAIDAELSQ